MIKQKLDALVEIFKDVSPLYIVGGCIRDKLLGKNSTDIDLCSNISLNTLQQMLKGTEFVLEIKNKTFGTANIISSNVIFEYSQFRKDYYDEIKKGRHSPNKIEFVDSLEEDIKRRDFTINTLYFNLMTNKIIDIFNAKNDIKKKVLKTVTPTTLNYDGERILRLVKFASLLDFKIDKQTFLSAKKNAKNVFELSNTIINKFLKTINNFTYPQKQKAKMLLKKLELNNLQELIKI